MIKKSIYLISIIFLFSCSQEEKYHGWLELTLIDSVEGGAPLSNRKVSIGIRSLKFKLFEHHLEVFEGFTGKEGKISFRPLQEKEYWITVFDENGKIYSMSLVETGESKNKVVIPIKKWELPKNSNGVPDINGS